MYFFRFFFFYSMHSKTYGKSTEALRGVKTKNPKTMTILIIIVLIVVGSWRKPLMTTLTILIPTAWLPSVCFGAKNPL